jgi:nicotinate-nucleotide adenylyltransferase
MGKLENDRVGILGGSFDPIHIGHLVIAERAIWELNLSKVIFIPANISPFKENNEAKNEERFEMVKLAILDNPKFEISDIEIKRGGVS